MTLQTQTNGSMSALIYTCEDGTELFCTSTRHFYFKHHPETWEIALFNKEARIQKALRDYFQVRKETKERNDEDSSLYQAHWTEGNRYEKLPDDPERYRIVEVTFAFHEFT